MQKQLGLAVLALMMGGCGAAPVTSLRLVQAPKAKAVAAAPAHHADVAANPDAMEARPVARQELTILAGNGVQQASASDGGFFRSADGSATVSIPPGALDRDAAVRLAPIDTTAKAVTNAFVPGIAFKLDLGGAHIQPGKAVSVTSPVDDRFVAAMQARDPRFSPDAYGLRKDATGAWQMTMPVEGPALMPVAAPEVPTGWALQEYGSFGVPGRALMAVDDAPRSTPQDCATFANVLGFGVPSDNSEVRAKEAEGVFVCDVVHKTDWFTNVMTDVEAPRPTCQAGDTPATPAVGADPMEVKAVVSIVGNDPLHARPAVGATVHWELLNLAGNGPQDVATDAGGYASTFTLPGQQLAVTAYTKEGLRSQRVTFKAVPGMGAVSLVLKLAGDDVK